MSIDNIETEHIDPESLTLKVSSEEANTRLDAFLASKIANWSRSRLQRLIEDGDVLVNEKTSKPSYKLRLNDEIDVELVQVEAVSFTPENIALNIIYEDDEVIVINKPAGLVIHPGAGVPNGTLANAVAYHLSLSAKNKASALPISHSAFARPGIVHRLDKDTSGLIVVAKTEGSIENLSEQFRERQVFKSYIALVHGVVQQDTGRIEEPISRDPRNRTRMATVRSGRPALSRYRVRQRFVRFTLLDVEIKTGRTHQIRVHLAFLKHPVVGDETYGGGRDKTVPDIKQRTAIAKLGRVFLHAAELGFSHPQTGEFMKFKADLPDELTQLLSCFA